MPYIYEQQSTPQPAEQGDLQFNVDNNMDLLATWDGGEENPFAYYLNSDNELIQEV